MDITFIANNALLIVGVILGIALIVFVVELIKTLRQTRSAVNDMTEQLKPTIAHVESITAKLDPAMDRIDPLLEHVELTIDAANLEIMRVDQILENVGEMTEGMNDAANAVSQIANAPVNIVSGLAGKAYRVLKRPDASAESIRLAAEKAARMKNLTAELENEQAEPAQSAEAYAGFPGAALKDEEAVSKSTESAAEASSEEAAAPQYFVMEDPYAASKESK